MYTIQVGSLVLNGQILLILAFGMLGWTALHFYGRKFHVESDIVSTASNAFLIWLLVWKGSPLLMDPIGVINHPESLIFLDGGTPGRWLGSVAAGGYVFYRFRKGNTSRLTIAVAVTVYLLGGATAYHAGLSWFESDVWVFHIGYAAVTLLALFSFLVTKQSIHWPGILQRWQWIAFGIAFVWFLNSERSLLFLSFGVQQIICIVAGIICLMIVWLTTRERRNV